MGAVYEAVDTTGRKVAVKMLRREFAHEPELVERFRSEAATLARLNHPSTASLLVFAREGEDHYMVMEYASGRTLEHILADCGRLPPQTAVSILCQTLDGMEHAHSVGVLHRDIKPANIMVAADGRVKVTDFGIARILGTSRLTRAGALIGTLEYLAPERILWSNADIRADIYSAGVVLFEMLAGRLPFTGKSENQLLQAHLNHPPPALGEVGAECPPELEAVMRKALEKDPARRFQTAREFRDALAAVPLPAVSPTTSIRSLFPWIALAAATVVASAVLGAWLLFRS
jgi:serine/threonine-protein kinase